MKNKKTVPNPFTWPACDWRHLGSNDWSLYFSGSLFRVKLKQYPDFLWAKIANSGLPVIEFKTELGAPNLQLQQQDIEAFDFSTPPTGAYNFKNSVVFFFKKFTRQWKKGLCKDSSLFLSILDFYKISGPLVAKVEKGFNVEIQFFNSPKNVSELFNCNYYSFEDAYKSLTERKVLARALTKDIVLSLGARNEKPILWFSSIPVGYVESSKPEIKLIHPEVRSEILTQIPRASFTSVTREEIKSYDGLSPIEESIAF